MSGSCFKEKTDCPEAVLFVTTNSKLVKLQLKNEKHFSLKLIAFDEGERILIVSFYDSPRFFDRDRDAMRFQGLDAILD